MENVYSALILHSLGKNITEAAVEKIVKAAGVSSPDKAQIKTLVTALGELDISEVLSGASMVAAAPTAAAPPKEKEKAEKKEKKEKKEEKKEADEPVGLDALFG